MNGHGGELDRTIARKNVSKKRKNIFVRRKRYTPNMMLSLHSNTHYGLCVVEKCGTGWHRVGKNDISYFITATVCACVCDCDADTKRISSMWSLTIQGKNGYIILPWESPSPSPSPPHGTKDSKANQYLSNDKH